MLLFLLACQPALDAIKDATSTTDGEDTGGESALVITEGSGETTRDGVIDIEVPVAEGDKVFQLLVQAESGSYPSLDSLTDPDGAQAIYWEDWMGAYSLTEAVYPSGDKMTLNYPIREEDPALTPGTWTATVAITNANGNYQRSAPVSWKLVQRGDDSFSSGAINVYVLYASDLADDSTVAAGIEAGVDYWKELYGSWGIDMTVTYGSVDVDPRLAHPYRGIDEVQAYLNAQGTPGVVLLVGDTIAGDDATFGEAAGIPGPFLPTNITVVGLSWIVCAGADGAFSEEDVYMTGETMAHEVGHFLGLFHPVEWNYDAWDALDDTPACTTWQACEGAMGDNLMFPYPICTARSCERQNVLSDNQTAVAHRYFGVDAL